MKSMQAMTMASLAATALTVPSLAAAQDNERYFDGVYVSGAVGIESAEDSNSQSLVFDTDGDGTFDDTVRTSGGDDAFAPGFCAGSATAATRNCRGNRNDVGYALRVGYDRHLGNGPFVAGILIEGARPGVEEFTSGFSGTPASYTIGREIDWAVTGRARLGIAPGEGRALFYATGGAGFARIDHSFDTSNTANSFDPSGSDSWKFGWQAGGGAEVMLTRNIGLGVEYLYSRYKDDEYVVAVGPGTAPATNPFLIENGGTDLKLSGERFDYHALRATVNLRF
jgi:outer membrane immunogenic protein